MDQNLSRKITTLSEELVYLADQFLFLARVIRATPIATPYFAMPSAGKQAVKNLAMLIPRVQQTREQMDDKQIEFIISQIYVRVSRDIKDNTTDGPSTRSECLHRIVEYFIDFAEVAQSYLPDDDDTMAIASHPQLSSEPINQPVSAAALDSRNAGQESDNREAATENNRRSNDKSRPPNTSSEAATSIENETGGDDNKAPVDIKKDNPHLKFLAKALDRLRQSDKKTGDVWLMAAKLTDGTQRIPGVPPLLLELDRYWEAVELLLRVANRDDINIPISTALDGEDEIAKSLRNNSKLIYKEVKLRMGAGVLLSTLREKTQRESATKTDSIRTAIRRLNTSLECYNKEVVATSYTASDARAFLRDIRQNNSE